MLVPMETKARMRLPISEQY